MPLHDDPLLRRWALDVAIDTVFVSPAVREQILDRVLPEAALADLLARIDQDELASLLRHLPAERWAAHTDLLADRWAGWSGSLAQAAARLIARFRPAVAGSQFQTFLAGTTGEARPDVPKLLGVIEGIRDLPGDAARDLLTAATRIVEQDDDLEFSDWQFAALAETALKVSHPDRIGITSEWLKRTTASEQKLNEALVRLGTWLFGDTSRVGFVRDFAAGYTHQTVAPLAGVVFRTDIPPVEIDNALRGLVLSDARSAQRLLEQHLESAGVGDLPEHWGTSSPWSEPAFRIRKAGRPSGSGPRFSASAAC